MNQIQEWRASKTWPYHICAGGVVFREANGATEIAILVRSESDGRHYHLPKGTLRHDETLEKCARREVLEESGVTAEIVGYLGTLQAVFVHPKQQIQIDKTTHYFAMALVSESRSHDAEHDFVEWTPIDKAKELVAKTEALKNEVVILARFEEFLKRR